MKNVYKVAFEKNSSSYKNVLLISLVPILTLSLSYLVSSYIFWVSVPLTIIYLIFFLIVFFEEYLKEIKYLKNKEEYLKDGKHTISTYSEIKTLNKLNGLRHGSFVIKFKNNNPKIKTNYKNGKLDGSYVSHYENGNIKLNTSYVEDKPNGSYLSYYENGQIELRTAYINGKLNGKYDSFYRNGQIKLSTSYINGKVDGLYSKYNSNGTLIFETNFSNGSQHGQALTYSHKGKLIRKSHFNNGDREGDTKEFYENGNTRMVNRDNTYIFFNENEIKICEINIDISSVKRVDYNGNSSEIGEPKAEGFNIKEKWTQFHENGIDIDYQIQVDTNSNKALIYEKFVNGNPTNTRDVNYEFKKYFFLTFHSSFLNERLRPKQKTKWDGYDIIDGNWEEIEGAHQYYLGYNLGNVKGPPGVGNSEIDIHPVKSLKDLISFENL